MSGMNIPTSLTSSAAMTALVASLLKPPRFFLDLCFPNIEQFTTDTIYYDVEKGVNVSAPFVNPEGEGVVINGRSYETRAVNPPYVKLLSIMRGRDTFKRRAGEPVGAAPNLQQRASRIVAENVSTMQGMVLNTKEASALTVLRDGKITISGQGIATETYDFRRSNALTIVLDAAARWDSNTATPMEDLEKAAELANKIEGVRITDIIVDWDSWLYLRRDPKLKDIVNLQLAIPAGFGPNAAQLGPVSVAGLEGAINVANVGSFRIWLYSAYVDQPVYDADGNFTGVINRVPTMKRGTVIGVAAQQVEGTVIHGAIQDITAIEANLAASEIFLDSWIEKRLGARVVSAQSAFLPVPKRANASFSIQVLAPNP